VLKINYSAKEENYSQKKKRFHHRVPPKTVQECTELGTIYTPDELKAITSLAHQYGMRVHMDGARIACFVF
jgi:threonine aldolase